MLGLVALAVAARVAYVLVVLDGVEPGLDAIWYQLQGGSIRSGTGFVAPASLFADEQVSTAAFPPGYPAYQAAWQWLVGDGPTSVRLAGGVPGALSVVLVAILGRRLAGPAAGLGAAAIVAAHPGLVAADGSAMSENLTVPLVLGAQVLALGLVDRHRHRRGAAPDLVPGRPHGDQARPGRSGRSGPAAFVARSGVATIGLGVVVGSAVLVRQDLVVFGALLVGWMVATLRPPARTSLVIGALVALGGVAMVVPWMGRNLVAVDAFTVSTLSPASAVAGANCAATYRGDGLGSWDYDCVVAARPGAMSEAELAEAGVREVDLVDAYQASARRHVRAELTRVPVVLAARQARAWSWWDPRDLAERDAEESRHEGFQVVARPVEALFALAGALGTVVLLRRQGRRALVLVVPVVAVAVSVSLGYGNPRFNVTAQPSLAIGLVAGALGVAGRES